MRTYTLSFLCVVIVTSCIRKSAAATQCYSCTYTRTADKTGAECMTEPWNVTTANTVKCYHPKICTTKRVYQHTIQEMHSFLRGCTVDMGNDCSTDYNYETCYTSCNSDYCNDGDGIPGREPTKPPGTLMCYSCTLKSDIATNTTNCVKEPWNVTIPHSETACKYPKMCTIERLSMHFTKDIIEFKRGCTDYKVNKCTKHALFESCSTSCETDYCNHGDGIHSESSGGTKIKSHFIGITVSLSVLRQYLLN